MRKILTSANAEQAEPVQEQKIIISSDMDEQKPLLIDSSENVIFMYDEIDSFSAIKLNKKILDLEKALLYQSIVQNNVPANIYLHLNTPGGELYSAISIMDTIKECKVPVITIVEGFCASGGSLISIVGKKRLMRKTALFKIHQLRSGMGGKYEELKDSVSECDKIMNIIKDLYKTYTKIPVKILNELLTHEILLDAKECLNYGIIDEII